MKDPREYLKGWNMKTDVDLEILISEIQKDAWNEAIWAAAKNATAEAHVWTNDTNRGADMNFRPTQVDKQSILKLMKKE